MSTGRLIIDHQPVTVVKIVACVRTIHTTAALSIQIHRPATFVQYSMHQTAIVFLLCLLLARPMCAQMDFITPFKECDLKGSTTLFDYRQKKWITSDEADAASGSLPASTFKIINLLIALETGVIADENDVVKWPGQTDTTLYGYRPDIYHDISVKEAFEVSAGWAFIELAKKIGKDRYRRYLKASGYGNVDLSEKSDDFWNFGPMKIAPKNQVEFLIRVYEEKLPFSKRNLAILKKVMLTEQTDEFTIRSKTGWTRVDGMDWGWWVGYVERNNNVYFFATRVSKRRSTVNPAFSSCRKEITKSILRQLNALPPK